MRWQVTSLWALGIMCGSVLLSSTAVGAPDDLTVQTLLAEQDAELVNRVVRWNESFFVLPDDAALDQALLESVAQLRRDHAARLRTLLPAWISEERAATNQPTLRGSDLSHALYVRSINEMAIASVESAGPADDEALVTAALAPTACRFQPSSPFARRIALIQAAPASVRPTLLAAEREFLSHWGTSRQDLTARPTADVLMAPDRAVTQLREGVPVSAAAMTPFFSAMVFERDRKRGKPDRWERCARTQWWLQTQLLDGKTPRAEALAIYRYSSMLDADDFVPVDFEPTVDPTRQTNGLPQYPRAASYFHVEGTTTMRVQTDNQGHALKAGVVEREIRVPGVRNNTPLAFETLLDDSSIDYARQRTYPAGKAMQVRFPMVWTLDKHDDAAAK